MDADKVAQIRPLHSVMLSSMSPSLDSLGTLITPANLLLSLLAIVGLSQVFKIIRRRAHTTQLSGPPSPGWLFGYGRILRAASDSASMYDGWSRAHGYVYALPAAFGTRRIILMDPKAITHFCARDTYGYVQNKLSKLAIQDLVSAHVTSSLNATGATFHRGDDRSGRDFCGPMGTPTNASAKPSLPRSATLPFGS